MLEGHSKSIAALAYSPDGTQLASGSFDNTIRLWDTATGAMQSTLDGIAITALSYSPNGRQLASKSHYTVQLWNPTVGAKSHTLEGHSARVWAFMFSPDGKELASFSADKTMRLWDLVNGTLKDKLETKFPKGRASFSVDGNKLAVRSYEDAVWLQDTKTRVVRILSTGSKQDSTLWWHNPIVFRLDGKQLALFTSMGIQIWDTATGVLQSTCKSPALKKVLFNALVFSPDGDLLADASCDNIIKLWDPQTGALCKTLKGHVAGVGSLAFHPMCKLLASGSRDGMIHLWDLSAEPLGSDDQSKEASPSLLRGQSDGILSVILSPDHQMLASCSIGGAVRVFNPRNGHLIYTLRDQRVRKSGIVFSPDSKQLIVGHFDGTIRFLDAMTGASCRDLRTSNKGLYAIAISSDSQQLALGLQSAIEILDKATGESKLTFEIRFKPITTMAFSTSGKMLATGDDGTDEITLWDLAAGVLRLTIQGEYLAARAVAFSNSEKWLASSSMDGNVRIWDLATGKTLQNFDLGSGVRQLSFSADDSYLDTGRGRVQLFSTSQTIQDQPTSAVWVLEHDWLVRNSEKMLWFPADSRPTCVANSGGLFVFVYASGQMDFVELDMKL